MLTTYLWKEAREQRVLLLALSAILVMLGVGWTLALPAELFPGLGWLASVGAIIGVALLGSDLVASDVRGGQLAHVARLPGAIGRAFLAKVIVYVLGVALLAMVGALIAVVVAHGRGAPELLVVSWGPSAFVLLLLLLAAGAWVLAVSCWMPRSVLVVPATALFLAATLGPMFLYWRDYVGLELRITDACAGLAWLAVAGVALARVSFGRCLRHPGQNTGLLRCIGLATLLLTPPWALGGYRLWQWHHVDPHASGTWLQQGLVGPDGRLAFLNVSAQEHFFAVVVDLQSGEWRQDGPAQSLYSPYPLLERSEFVNGRGAPQGVVLRQSATPDGQSVRANSLCYIDAATGDLLARRNGLEFAEELTERLRTSQANASCLCLDDGRRVFFFRGQLLAMGSDGTTEALPWPEGYWPGHVSGAGFSISKVGCERGWYDLSRRRVVACPHKWPRIRAGAWIVGTADRPQLWQPETGAVSPLRNLAADERIGPLFDARQVLVWRENASWVDLLDPETGERRRLRFADGSERAIRGVHGLRPEQDLRGAPQIAIGFERGKVLARIAGDVLTTTATAESIEFVGSLDDDTVLAIVDGRTLERLHFGSDERDVVFPR